MKPFALGLTLASLLIFAQGTSAATPTPSATRTTSPSPTASISGAPSPSVSGTPRQTSNPEENPTYCAAADDATPDKFTCDLGSNTITNCADYDPCIALTNLSNIPGAKKRHCLPEKKTLEECVGLSVPPPTSPILSAPFVQPKDLGELAVSLYRWSLRIIGLAVLIVFFIGLFMQLTAAGLPMQVGQAKSLMTNAAMGAALLLAAYVILNTINPDFVKQSSSLPGLPANPELIQNGSPVPATTLPTN